MFEPSNKNALFAVDFLIAEGIIEWESKNPPTSTPSYKWLADYGTRLIAERGITAHFTPSSVSLEHVRQAMIKFRRLRFLEDAQVHRTILGREHKFIKSVPDVFQKHLFSHLPKNWKQWPYAVFIRDAPNGATLDWNVVVYPNV
jgi:hypothetical protein